MSKYYVFNKGLLSTSYTKYSLKYWSTDQYESF